MPPTEYFSTLPKVVPNHAYVCMYTQLATPHWRFSGPM